MWLRGCCALASLLRTITAAVIATQSTARCTATELKAAGDRLVALVAGLGEGLSTAPGAGAGAEAELRRTLWTLACYFMER